MAIRDFVRDLVLRLDKNAAARLKEETEEALAKAGAAGGESFTEAMEKGGRQAVRALTKTLQDEHRKALAQARIDLSKGLIDTSRFREIAAEADRTFNRGLIAGMEKLRAEGKLTDAQFVSLANRIRTIPDKPVDRATSAVDRLRRMALRAAAAVGAIFAVRRIIQFTRDMFTLGTEVEETAAKFRTTFGPAADAMQGFLDGFTALAGLSRVQGRDMAATIAAIFQGMGGTVRASQEFSEAVLGLAGDLQAFHNVPIHETFQALRSGLTGQTGPLQRFGIVVRAAEVEQRALAMSGKTAADSLTEQEKVLARLQLITERAGVAVGQMARESDSAASQARVARAAWDDFRETLADVVVGGVDGTGIFDDLRRVINALTDAVRANEDAIRDFIRRALNALGDALVTIVERMRDLVDLVIALGHALVIGGVTRAIVGMGLAFRGAARGVTGLAAAIRGLHAAVGPTGWLILGVGVLTELFFKLRRASREAREEAEEALAAFKDTLGAMSDAEMDRRLADNARRIRELRSEINQLRRDAARAGQGANALAEMAAEKERELNRLRQEGLAIIVERGKRAIEAAKAEAEAGAGAGAGAPTGLTPEEIRKREEALNREVSLLLKGLEARVLTHREIQRIAELERQLTEELAGGNLTIQRRIELRKQLRELEAPAAAVRRLEAGDFVPTDDIATPFPLATIPVEPVAENAQTIQEIWVEANQNILDAVQRTTMQMVDDFRMAGELLFEEGASIGDFFENVFRATGKGAIAMLANIAEAKATENALEAAEQFARAIGAAFTNPPAVGAHLAAGAQHMAIAAAWGALGGVAGGTANAIGPRGVPAGRGDIPRAPGDTSGRLFDGMRPPQTEVHVYVDPFDPSRPAIQRQVYAAQQFARERFGDNARVIVHPRAEGRARP